MVQRLLRHLGIGLVWVIAVHLIVSAQRDQPANRNAPIRLRASTFTPAQGERPALPAALVTRAARGQRSYYLVQFSGPILDAWKQALTTAGAEILEYVPEFAFKVRMTRDQADAVAALEAVTWVDDYHAGYKLAGLDVASGGNHAYAIRVERGADAAALSGAISATGAQVTGRSGSIITAITDRSGLDAIARLADVADIAAFSLREKHNEYGGGVIMGANAAHAAGFDGSTQTIALADSGFGGGTPTTAHPDLRPPRLAGLFNWPGAAGGCFVSVTDDGAADVNTGHGTHTTLSAAGGGGPAGQGRGTAPGAAVIVQAVENWAVPSAFCSLIYGIGAGYYLVGLPGDLHPVFQQAYDAGARIHSDSWGADASGAYNSDSAEVDDFIWNHKDMTVTFSAGNAGVDGDGNGQIDPGSLAAPASSKNAIAVGASENDRQSRWDCDASLAYADCATTGAQNTLFTYGATWPTKYPAPPLSTDASAGNAEQMAAFSSRGPSSDGRIKPDVVAPGTWVLSGYSDLYQQQYDSLPNPQTGLYQYDGWGTPLSAQYKYMGGTSMANPLVAGAAAVVRDFYRKTAQHEASAALVKAALVNAAVDLLDENNDGLNDNAFPIPNVHEGWGRVNVAAVVSGHRQFVDHGQALTTNASWAAAYSLRAGHPFKVTLAWSDYPSSTAAAKNLVNDLDLRITGPAGVTYLGNAFAGGWSQSGGAPDRVNNLENVFVAAPAAGEWVIEVVGYNVPFGPQPFALVIDGDTEGPASPLPTVTVSAVGGTAHEAGPLTTAFTVARAGATNSPLTVRYSLGGTATRGVDYIDLPGLVTISPGSATANVVLTPIDDSEVEADETVTFNIVADAAYSVGTPASGGTVIVSNDSHPDLLVTALDTPDRATPGEPVLLTDTTKNQGAGGAPPSITRFYLSTNFAIDAADTLLGDRPVPALAAGAADSGSATLTIPAETASGTYYVLARADGALAVTESSETNNTKFQGPLQIGADLTVSALAGPAAGGAGESILVNETTANIGTVAAAATVTAFYLSTNLSIDASDVTLGSRPVLPLAPATFSVASTTLTIPSAMASGSYYILAKADAALAVTETSESNNVKYSAQIKIGPDLVVSALTVPSTAAPGGTLAINDTTQNGGGGSASPTTTVFYLSINSVLDATDTVLGSRPVSALAPGATHAAGMSLVIPAATVPRGYYVLAQADGNSALAESNEANNTRVAGPVQIGPDLVVSAVSAPATAAPGSTMVVTDTTRNQGGGAASSSVTTFYLSSNPTFDANDLALGSRNVSALASAGTESATSTLNVPAETPTGSYYVLAVADGLNAVAETTETNNVRFSAVVRIGADLVVWAVGVPTTVVPAGSLISISDTTGNPGTAAAGASTTAFYLSPNASLDASDLRLGARSVGPLAPGASEAQTTAIVVPATLTPGTYYVFAQADTDGVVTETSETNNIRLGWIRIGAP